VDAPWVTSEREARGGLPPRGLRITFHPDNVAAIFFARSFTLAPAMPETIHN